MRAAIVGAGGAGLLHALSLRAHGVAVAQVFDPDPERARNLAELCGGHAVDTLDAIADGSAECVCLCSPPREHAEQAERCARGGGRVVFVEKPVVVNSSELDRLAVLPGCVPVVQWRAGRSIRAVRAAQAEGLLGPSPTVSVDLALERRPEYFDRGRGRRDGWGCGALLSVGIHALDAVCFALARDVVGVRGVLGPVAPGEVERAAAVLVAFEGGAVATVRVTFDGGGGDQTRMAFCGGGVTAVIAGAEADPTACPVRFLSANPAKRGALDRLERATWGHAAAPLMVPYLGEALAALRAGQSPGQCEALPSIRDVQAAHDIALRAYEDQGLFSP